MVKIQPAFGKRLKQFRELRNLTQEALSLKASQMPSKQAYIKRSYISEIESGKRNPSLEMIHKLAQALDIPAFVLLLSDKDLRKHKDLKEYFQ